MIAQAREAERLSIAGQVAADLRERILRGEIAPGARLREVAVAKSAGVSRNTVREAIRILEHEGIVTSHLYRGATVSELSEEDVVDIFRVREVVELAAVEATAGSGDGFERLADAVEELRQGARSGEWQRLVEADLRFHGSVAALLGSRRLDDLYRNIQGELRRCLSILLVGDEEYTDPESEVAEHQAIRAALAAGRSGEAEGRIRRHLHDNRERLLEILRAREGT